MRQELRLERKIIFNLMLLVEVSIKLKKPVPARTHLNSAVLGLGEEDLRDLAECARLEAEVLKLEGKKPDEKYQRAIALLKDAGLAERAEIVAADYDDYVKNAA